jgi:methionyl-tRNA formyltransferase
VLQWAIINGERETGVTLHYLDDAFDTGPLIDERRIPIGADDDAATLSEKLRVAGVSLLRAHWEAIVTGSVTARPQPEGGRYWPARTAEDGRIDWQTSAEQIDRLARALVAPWPGAFFEVEGQRVVIDRALPTTGASGATPGTVLEVHSNEVVVAAGSDSAVTLSDFHIDGVSVAAAELGLAPGDFLGGKL